MPADNPDTSPGMGLNTPLPTPLEWRVDDGLTGYDHALTEMEARARAIRDGGAGEQVWLVQHPPVYTAGSSAKPGDLLNPGDALVRETGRGGEWTWHGPGQRVGYTMLDVEARGRDIRRFVRQVEEWVILTLGQFGLEAMRRDGLPGVWLMRDGAPPDKIAAIGIRMTRWVSWHGMAINLDPDLTTFEGIVPCGVDDGGVTSLHREGVAITMDTLDEALRQQFNKAFEF